MRVCKNETIFGGSGEDWNQESDFKVIRYILALANFVECAFIKDTHIIIRWPSIERENQQVHLLVICALVFNSARNIKVVGLLKTGVCCWSHLGYVVCC